MSEKYKVHDPEGIYFITITVVGWVDLFIRRDYKECLLESIKFCQNNKGLKVHAWVFMSSHIHLIVSATYLPLPAVIRDFKTHTSKSLIRLIKEIPESRREWILKKFAFEANRNLRGTNYKLWQDGFHPLQLSSNEMIDQRLNYIHQNPVKEGIVYEQEEYVYSSAKNYAGLPGLISVEMLD